MHITDSPYRKAITGAILKMSEEGKLHKLKTRWWKEKGVKGIYDETERRKICIKKNRVKTKLNWVK